MNTPSNLLSFIKTEEDDPWSEDEDNSSGMESCKRVCLEENVSDEVNMDDITEITVTLSDSEDLFVNGNVPAGDNDLQGNETVTFEQIFETQSDLPMCWTEDQANYFRTQNPWLQIRNGRLGCAVCIEVGALSLHQHVRGSRLAREWLQFLIGSTSITKKGQQSALRKKIWEHRESHAHQQAEKVLLQAQAGLFDLPPPQTRSEEHETTCRIFRTAYMISKLNRPFSDMPDLVELQVANGADMGRVLHSRKSCAEICDFIGEEMKKKIIGYMIEKDVKFSVLVEECTTVNNKPSMAVCIRAAFGEEFEPLTIFFQLLELQEMTDEAIATELQCCLHEHFPTDFIARNWISFTADGASATVNWASGVAALLNMSECYPTLVIWHCCNHRLELAVAEALEEVTGAHSFKVFIDTVYCLYQISPKNQRELHTCAEEFAVLLKATNKVLDTRMVASSRRTVTAVWEKYPSLCAHFKAAVADLKRSNTEKAKYRSLVERLTSVEFVKNLGVMRDALKMLSELSLRLQVNSITLPEAHILICQQMQVFMELSGGKEAEFTRIALESATNLKFQGVVLNPEQKVEVEINKESFFQSLTNCLQSRLMTSSARAASSSEEVSFSEFDDLFPACKVLYPQYWPEDADFQYGENEVLSLCRRFQLPAQQIVQGFREYKASGGRQTPEQLRPLLTTLKTIAISASECERVFTDMNNTITSVRSSLQISRVSNLLFLQRNGPPLAEFHPETYVVAWLAQGRHNPLARPCAQPSTTVHEPWYPDFCRRGVDINKDQYGQVLRHLNKTIALPEQRSSLPASTPDESQLLPGNNFTTECNIPGIFMCGNGRCIPGAWQCDGLPDCFDASDEHKCPKVKSKCGPTFFPCASGVHCIIGRFQCNGFEDCPDGSDEENCTANPLLCSTARFHCKNGLCVDKSFVCDGQDNCHDNSDEEQCDSPQEGGSGQDYVTSDNKLLYYPSITYAIIGSSVIFVLVVALLALVLHHQRKRNNLMTLPVHRLQHPVLLSRLVVLDHPHHCSVTYNVNNGVQYVSGQGYQRPSGPESPPSYSEAVLDQSRPPWYDLPPPPYSSHTESSQQCGLPPYRSRTGSSTSLEVSRMGSCDSSRITDSDRTPLERTPGQSDPLLNATVEGEN